MLIKGEEGTGGAESLEAGGQEGEEVVEVGEQKRILSGSHQELKHNRFKGNKSRSLTKVGNINLQLSKVEVESVFGDVSILLGCTVYEESHSREGSVCHDAVSLFFFCTATVTTTRDRFLPPPQ